MASTLRVVIPVADPSAGLSVHRGRSLRSAGEARSRSSSPPTTPRLRPLRIGRAGEDGRSSPLRHTSQPSPIATTPGTPRRGPAPPNRYFGVDALESPSSALSPPPLKTPTRIDEPGAPAEKKSGSGFKSLVRMMSKLTGPKGVKKEEGRSRRMSAGAMSTAVHPVEVMGYAADDSILDDFSDGAEGTIASRDSPLSIRETLARIADSRRGSNADVADPFQSLITEASTPPARAAGARERREARLWSNNDFKGDFKTPEWATQ